MSEKQRFQLKQFKIFSYDEWAQQATSYIPSLGEICGIIVHNDDEKLYFPLPDGYELVQPPFTLLKMGDGITTMDKLSWVTATESEVVTNILNRILRNMEVQGEKIPLLTMVQDYVKENSADWLEIDPLSAKYIKNKICSFNHNVLDEPIPIVNNQILSIPISDENYIKLEFDQNDIVLDKDYLQPYNLYNLNFNKNSKTNFLNQVLKTYNYNEIRYLYLGNLSLIEDSLENTQEKYCILFKFLDYELDTGLDNYNILCSFSRDLFEENQELNLLNLTVDLNLTHQTSSITPIDNIWLSEEVTAKPDWYANNTENGYILNKICQIDSYKSLSQFLTEIELYSDNDYMGEGQIKLNNFISKLSKLNYYSLYENNNKLSETRPTVYTLDEEEDYTYILGNPYLYWKLGAEAYQDVGQSIPDLNRKYLNIYPDNKTDICLMFKKQKNQDYWSVLYLKRWGKFNEIKNKIYKYKSPVNYTINSLNSLICSGNQKQILIDKNIKYILLDNKGLEITDIKYDNNSNSTIIQLAKELEDKYLNYTFNPNFFANNSQKKITIKLTQEPDAILTIDPIWLPDNALVGAYGAHGRDNKAEIFNDLENNQALGYCSHAEGINTVAAGEGQHVQGKYNLLDENSNYSFIIGNGQDNSNRSNAYSLDWQGNSIQQGKVYATDFINFSGESLTSKENISNKVTEFNFDTINNNEYPTTQAVYSFLQNLFNLTINKQEQIILNIEAIDGNTFYGKDEEFTRVDGNNLWDRPFIDLNT